MQLQQVSSPLFNYHEISQKKIHQGAYIVSSGFDMNLLTFYIY